MSSPASTPPHMMPLPFRRSPSCTHRPLFFSQRQRNSRPAPVDLSEFSNFEDFENSPETASSTGRSTSHMLPEDLWMPSPVETEQPSPGQRPTESSVTTAQEQEQQVSPPTPNETMPLLNSRSSPVQRIVSGSRLYRTFDSELFVSSGGRHYVLLTGYDENGDSGLWAFEADVPPSADYWALEANFPSPEESISEPEDCEIGENVIGFILAVLFYLFIFWYLVVGCGIFDPAT
ncbi:hypothetical protein F66182_3725 [Fusarium sp. NRRL 66182]|nr:hypothetical protein F66182_3725 [Fusarium sp. NRRL 66182]